MPDELVQMHVTGLAELSRAMLAIPATLSRRIMREALHAFGDVVAVAAEATAPVRTGALREDVIVKVHVSGDLTRNFVRIGPGYDRAGLPVRKRGRFAGRSDTTRSPGVYGKFLELGTHKMPPHPWLRPAWEASKDAALETFVAYCRAGLEAVLSELTVRI